MKPATKRSTGAGMLPPDTDSSPAIMRSVVFPHPEGPTRTMNSPSPMARSMPRTAGTSPKCLERFGRLDMTVRFNDNVYLFEFKVVELTPPGAAMAQLKERRYADKYRDLGQPIHLIAVEFSNVASTVRRP